jgi:hypothetical protein
MKAKDLKPGDKLTVCGVEWHVDRLYATYAEMSSGDDLWSPFYSIIDTMLENGATVRRDGPIVVEGVVYVDSACLGCAHGLETRGALMKAVKETGWRHGTPVKITVEKL